MTESADPTTAVARRRIAVLVGVAFVVKLAVLLQLRGHPLLQPLGELDTAYYVDVASRIAREGVLAPVGASVVSPLYLYFLAAVFAAGGSLLAAQLIQIALGSAAVGLVFATTRHWFGERAAVVAAGLAIITGPLTFNEVLILQSALDPFLVASALYGLTRATRGGAATHAAAGVALGLLSLNRPNAIVFAAAAVVILTVCRLGPQAPEARGRRDAEAKVAASRTRKPFARAAMPAVVMATALAGVLGANAARHYAASGDVVLIASHGGLNLYIGNHERADGTYTPVPGISPSIAGQARDAARVVESAIGRPPAAGEVSDYFTRRAFEWIVAHPGDAGRLTLRKIAILLNRTDVPLNYSYAYYASEPGSILRALPSGPWLILPLGLVGLLWPALRDRREGYWAWASFVPVYGASVVIFFVADRYRMPLLVPLCAAAGAAGVRLFELARRRKAAPLFAPAGALVLACVVVFADLGLDPGVSGEQTRHAVWLVERGRVDEARRYVEGIAGAHTHPGVLRYRIGRALLEVGRHGDATEFFGQALAIDGPRPAIRLALGEALLGSGRPGEAVPHLEAAADGGHEVGYSGALLVRAFVMTGRPDAAIARLSRMADAAAGPGADGALDFGILALEHGAAAEAARWLQLAAQRAPGNREAREHLGVALFLRGDPLAALPHLEEACRLEPTCASAHLNLASVYAELGRHADARRHAAEALRLDPAESRATALLKALPK